MYLRISAEISSTNITLETSCFNITLDLIICFLLKRQFFVIFNFFLILSTLFKDLSKVLDILKHKLLVSQSGVYEFKKYSVIHEDLLQCFNARQLQVCVNNCFSFLENIIARVPQGSKLAPLLFIVFINVLFLFKSSSNFNNYADGKILHDFRKNLEEPEYILRTYFALVILCLYENCMADNVGNIDLCLSQRIPVMRP